MSEESLEDQIYRNAAEKLAMSRKDRNVQFSIEEVNVLLEVSQKDIVALSEFDAYKREDILRIASQIPITEGRINVKDLPLSEYQSLLAEYVAGKRNDDGQFIEFHKISELSEKYNVCPRSLVAHSLTDGWHEARIRSSMALVDSQRELALAEIEQIKPRIALLGIRITEKILKDIYDRYDSANDIEENEKLVSMVSRLFTSMKPSMHVDAKHFDEISKKMDDLNQRMQANLEKTQPEQGQKIYDDQIVDAEFRVSTPQDA